MTSILLQGATVITMSASRPDAERVDILIEDGRINEIGDGHDWTYAETVDLAGRIVVPGLINAHLHACQPCEASWLTVHEPVIAERITSRS
jgi:5-methylthioadenosine/S-adenosylhomocysteine deaminase